ncbi:MAG: Cof-type HAD-IIB family hydrolase [Sphaerochaetaceae bacterium]|nr:Cof-type HAD-IIB family hydrolase [Sphaerochaetaceae bacterium]
MIKLICLDIDGTLIDDNLNIPEANIKAVRHAYADCGVKVCTVSGRISQSSRFYMDRLGVSGPVSSLGGCLLENEKQEIIKEFNIDRDVCNRITEFAEKYHMSLLMYHHYNWYVDGTTYPKWIESEYNATHIKETRVCSFNSLFDTLLPNKFLAVNDNHDEIKLFQKELAVTCGDRINTFLSWPEFLEVVPPEANKGRAVLDLCSYYGFSKDEVMAVGDYYNDIFMFEQAGISVAVANAPDEVKKRAFYTSEADNNHAAVAEAIEKFVG